MSQETPDPTLISQEMKRSHEIRNYLEELTRVSAEIKDRYSKGNYLQVMSSLAALPNLHRVILDECENASNSNALGPLLETNDKNGQEDESSYFGLYL